MSELLNAILQERRDNVSDYEEFLRKMAELARKVAAKHSSGHYPASIINRPQRAFHDNLGRYAGLAVDVDGAIRRVKEAHWRGNNLKEKRVRREIARTLDLPMDDEQVSVIFEIALAQDDY